MTDRSTHETYIPSIEDSLSHIWSMIEGIEAVLATKATRTSNEKKLWPLALERMFEIIGVAASHIPAEIKRSSSEVDWEMIASLDRRLANPLVRIDERTLLNAAARLNPLKSFVSKILA